MQESKINEHVNTDYQFSVKVGDEILKISGSSLQLVKFILDEHFSNMSNCRKTISVCRQPLFPNSSKEVVEQVEAMDARSKQRRENFAKTSLAKLDNNNATKQGIGYRYSVFTENVFQFR